jgi:hypothetical protein
MAETLTRNLENFASAFTEATTSKPITTRAHAVLDYTLGPALIIAPQALGFATKGAAAAVPRVFGAAGTVVSSMTQYELGIYPVIPMRTHLMIDVMKGILMAASPWLFGFGRSRKKSTWLPHLLLGVSDVAIAAMTDSRSTRLPRA